MGNEGFGEVQLTILTNYLKYKTMVMIKMRLTVQINKYMTGNTDKDKIINTYY